MVTFFKNGLRAKQITNAFLAVVLMFTTVFTAVPTQVASASAETCTSIRSGNWTETDM
ncbi:MAG TPA: hypothetical protein PKW33_20855 [Anaerolineaceae bacterium]|nr:hypothetical protein [Anaerolineaceae bacterium]HPN54059.1 hypothetical protein [Anaerolineaceae bacterium]